MIVSLSGSIGSGKDTVSDYLVADYGFNRMSFADTLKDSVAAVFSWDRTLIEGKTSAAREWRETVDTWWANRLGIPTLTPRWVLQNWGTEVCRKYFHEDIWIASLERKLRDVKKYNIVISDARFVNEIEMLSVAGAITVGIMRGELPNWWETARRAHYDNEALKSMQMIGIHRSEWDWVCCNFDVVINNNSNLDKLYTEIDTRVLNINNLELT